MTTSALFRAIARPSTHPFLKEALAAAVAEEVRLKGACNPSSASGAGFIPAFTAATEGLDIHYAFLPPALCGLSAAELAMLFAADEAVPALPFKHRTLKGVDEDVLGRLHPFYDAPGADESTFSPPSGLTTDGEVSYYCLVIRNEEDVVVGYVTFDVRLHAAERDIYCDNPSQEAATLSLRVRVFDLYVLTNFRGKGAATTACQAIAHVVTGEVSHLAEQVCAAADALKHPFNVEVVLESEMHSQASALVDSRLLDLIEGDLALMLDVAGPGDALKAVQLLAVASDSSW